jgi:iron complex transport system substrate-binding protein
MARILSLLPSATEIVCALGHGAGLVGRSHECDFPRGVERLPVCTAPKLDPSGSSRAIHEDVEMLLRQAVSIYELDACALRSLAPEVIVTQTQCEVCAVSQSDVERALADWLGDPPRLVALSPASLHAVWSDMLRVAEALGTPEAGITLVNRLRGRMAGVSAAAHRGRARPTVACIEWLDPPMAAGNWMPELVAMAGGRNLFGAAGEHSPWLDWGALLAADPDVIVVMPCGFALERTRREAGLLAQRPGWHGLRAVREGRVFLADGHQYFNRPGPRLVESLEMLAEVLHPGHCRYGHQGSGWEVMAS